MARRPLFSIPPGQGEVIQALANADANFVELYNGVVDIPQGRLTLVSGSPVMNASASGIGAIYYTPYIGTLAPIYDGSNFVMTDTGGELSQLNTDATKSPAAVTNNSLYDMFVWNDNGTIRCTRGPAWTNTTTRSMALTRVRGTLVNSAAITNGPAVLQGTYVGTVAANTTGLFSWIYGGAASGGTAARLDLWNMYNRCTFNTRVTDTIAPYTYTTATIRQAGGSANNNVRYLIGVADDAPTFYYQQNVTTAATAGATCQISIGDDSAIAFELGGTYFAAQAAIAATGTLDVVYTKGSTEPLVGQHTAYALELGDGLNANTFNVGSAGELSAILRA